MEVLNDWKFWMFIMQLVTIFGGGILFAIIKFNDFKHVEESIKKLSENIEAMDKTIGIQGNQIARIEGKLGIKE